MYHDVVSVKCRDDFELDLTFDDGKSGVLDCKPIIAKGGVFSRLRDPEVFKRARVNTELGVVTWDDEVDIAPETAYSRATGSPLPEWMEPSEHPDAPDKSSPKAFDSTDHERFCPADTRETRLGGDTMTLTLKAQPVPLVADGDGVVRVAKTRVTLDTVIAAFHDGLTAEEIVEQYPSLELGPVYAVISYYLCQRVEVDAYL